MAMENELKTDPADLIEQDPVLYMLGVLIGAKSKWLGTASALLDQLIIIGAETKSVMPNDPRWPKNAAQLSHHLRTARLLLDEMGIVYEFDRKEWKRLHILYEAKAFPAAAKAHFAKRAEADRAREQAAQAAAAQADAGGTRRDAASTGTRRDAASTAQAGTVSSGAASCTTDSGAGGCVVADAAGATAAANVAAKAPANGNGQRQTPAAKKELPQDNAKATKEEETPAAAVVAGPATSVSATGSAMPEVAVSGPNAGGPASCTTAEKVTGCVAADAPASDRDVAHPPVSGAGEGGH